MNTLTLSGLLGLALTSISGAQATAPQGSTAVVSLGATTQQFDGPIQHFTLNYATGKLERLTSDDAVQSGVSKASTPTFTNACTSGSFVATTPVDELVDWGTKGTGATTIVDSFVFGYGTDAVDLSLSGPGASVDVAFYEGTTGGGVLGTEVARYTFAGLPGSTTGGLTAYTVLVDLTGGFEFCLSDGDIGYGYCSTDPGSTGPLLIGVPCLTSGTVDVYDSYSCPASSGTYGGSFFFGSGPIASFYMEIFEDDGSEVTATFVDNGSGVNPVVLSDGGVGPVPGVVWSPIVDTAPSGHAASACLWYQASLPPGTLIIGVGEIIIDPTSGNDFTNTILGTGLNDHSVLVPKDLSLVGADYTVQSIMFTGGPPIQLTNALQVHIGF